MKRLLLILFLLALTCALLPSISFASCDYPSFCNTLPRNGPDPMPGQKCNIPGITTDANGNSLYGYHYGTSSTCGLFGSGGGTCTPRCGFLGQGWCCDPDNKSNVPPNTANIVPPPCNDKLNGGNTCSSLSTALGTFQTDIGGLTKNIFSVMLGFSGGIAVLLIIAAGYQLMVSQGNPEKVKEARERLVAAIVGLIFIFFSVTILQIIGVNLLQIPGFK